MKVMSKRIIYTIVILILCTTSAVAFHLRHRMFFLLAYHRSVSAVVASRSDWGFEFAFDAADESVAPEDRRFVQNHCLAALSSEDTFYPNMVAFYVLIEQRENLLDETVASLKTLAVDPAFSKTKQESFVYVIKEYEKKKALSVTLKNMKVQGTGN